MKVIPKCYKTREMCVKVVDTYFFVFDSVRDWYKTQEMCDESVSNYPFMLICYLDRYNTQKCVTKPLITFYQH